MREPSASFSNATSLVPQRTLLDNVWDSIVTPGASEGLVITVNASIAALLLSLGYFSYHGLYSSHLAVMAFLAIGLCLTFNVFVAMQKTGGAAKGTSGSSSTDVGVVEPAVKAGKGARGRSASVARGRNSPAVEGQPKQRARRHSRVA
jgi:energy-converting hydrogenase Eha subunit E